MAHASAAPVSGSKLDNRRVLAALIDLVIVGAGWAVILAAAGKLSDPAGGGLVAVGLGWALYYYFACESGSGQTVGKRVMNIRVVGVDGAPAGMREIALRTVLRVIDGLFLYLVGLIVMVATKERRGRLGDLVGDTMIVSADEPAPRRRRPGWTWPRRRLRAVAATRVPIAESGPAFEPEVENEPEVESGPEPDVASPSLKELASDVSAVTEDPEREVEEEGLSRRSRNCRPPRPRPRPRPSPRPRPRSSPPWRSRRSPSRTTSPPTSRRPSRSRRPRSL